MMAERGTFFVPTLTVYVFHREVSAPHVLALGPSFPLLCRAADTTAAEMQAAQ